MQNRTIEGFAEAHPLLGVGLFAGGALVATGGVVLLALVGPSVWGDGVTLARLGLALAGALVPGAVLALHRGLGPATTARHGSVVGGVAVLVGLAAYAFAPLAAGSHTPLVLAGLGCFALATVGLVGATLWTAVGHWRDGAPRGTERPAESGWSRAANDSESGPSDSGSPGPYPADGGESATDLEFPLDDETEDRTRDR